ncbi:MAG: hypothetical protein NT019_00445 [Candidatus Adlerbacteria bacterium]|nr:hypothetical protein [Candidatus Adlerbacteria bacterium]
MQNLKMAGLCGIMLVLLASIGSLARLREMKMSVGNPAAYAEAHALDPLFAFPGFETADLKTQIAAFKISASVALPAFPEGAYVRDHIYPFRFLDLLPQTEEARRQVLAEPTLEHATLYHTLLLSLIAAHKQDLEDAVALLAHDMSGSHYELFSGQTTATHIRSVLTETLKTDTRAEEKEKARFACLSGTTRACESLTKLQLQFGPHDGGQNLPPTESVLNSVLENRDALTVAYPSIDTRPLISLTQSSCFTNSPAFFAVVGGVSRLSNLPTTQAVYLSDLYFEDVRTSTQPFYAALRKEGDSFTYQPFRAYLCPDAGIDFGTTVTIQRAYDTLRQNPFTPTAPISPLFETLVSAQKNFTEAPFLTDTAYDAFIRAATETVRGTPKDILTERLGGQTEVLRLIELVTEAETNSADFAGTIGYFDDLQIGGSIIYNLQSSPTIVYFISRGGLSQLYALNNKTISPTPEPLTTQRAAPADQISKGEGVPYVSYMQTHDTEPAFSDIRTLLTRDIPARARVLSPSLTQLQQKRAEYVRARTH